MKWIRRNKLNLAALMLAFLIAAMFIRSFWRHDRIEWYSTHRANSGWLGDIYEFGSLHGELQIAHMRRDYLPGHQPPPEYRNVSAGPIWHVAPIRTFRMVSPDEWPFGVRNVSSNSVDDTSRWTYFIMPHWLLLVLLSIVPAVSFVRYLIYRRRIKVGHCPACGYDLRASPGRCPECGAVPTAVP